MAEYIRDNGGAVWGLTGDNFLTTYIFPNGDSAKKGEAVSIEDKNQGYAKVNIPK